VVSCCASRDATTGAASPVKLGFSTPGFGFWWSAASGGPCLVRRVALRSIFKDHAGPFSRVRAAHGETQEEPKSGPVSSDGVRGLQYVGRETGPGIRLKRGGQPRHERLPKSPAQRAAEDAIRELRDCCALDGLFAKIDAVQVGGQWYLKVMPDELAEAQPALPAR
jgi:hypothetical protein